MVSENTGNEFNDTDLDFDEFAGLDLDLDEMISNEGLDNEEVEEIDLFKNKYDPSFYGITPNVILKEDTDVLNLIVQLAIQTADGRMKLFNLVEYMKIFLKHIEIQYNKIDQHPDVDEQVAGQIVNTFTIRLNSLLKCINTNFYDVDIDKDANPAIGKLLAPSNASAQNVLVNRGEVEKSITEIFNSGIYDSYPDTCPAVKIANRYHSYIYTSTYLENIREVYLTITQAQRKDMIDISNPTVKLTLNTLSYSKRSYIYSKEELIAMKYLGFPYLDLNLTHGMEKYFKSDTKGLFDDLCASKYVGRSKVKESIRANNFKKETNITYYHDLFTRKKIMCMMNQEIGVNTNCIYF